MVYKCLNGMAPQYLNDKVICNDNIHKYCKRSAKDVHVKNLTLHIMLGVLKYVCMYILLAKV